MVKAYSENQFFALLGLSTPRTLDARTGLRISRKLEPTEKRAILQHFSNDESEGELVEKAAQFFEKYGSAYYRNDEDDLIELEFCNQYASHIS